MRASVFFSILRSRWTGHRSGEDFVKFGDRLDKQVENSGNPSTYWRQGRTDCLKLASPRKKFLENWRIFWIFPKFLLWGLHCHFFFVADWRIFGKKKHTHTAMNALSQLGTQVSKVYTQTLLSYSLDSECAPGFRFSRKYFWGLNGLSFKGIRRRKNGDQPQEGLAQYGYGPAMTCTNN